MPKWKKCPKCGGSIPENWNRHNKCGWNVKKSTNLIKQTEKDTMTSELEKSIDDAVLTYRSIKQKYPEECSQLDLTKIALSLFIQRERKKQSFILHHK
jgi:hypothetical protein